MVKCDVLFEVQTEFLNVRFQVLSAASVKFRFVVWDVLQCKIIVQVRTAFIIRAISTYL
jgi:hypothetical protein